MTEVLAWHFVGETLRDGRQDELIGPVWITKYALTEGITKLNRVVWNRSANLKMISLTKTRGSSYTDHYYKPDWHLSEAEAMERAEKLRNAALNIAFKKVSKLRSMTFVVKEEEETR